MTLEELKKVAEANGVQLRVTNFGEYPYLGDGNANIMMPDVTDGFDLPPDFILYALEAFGLEGVDLESYLY